MILDRERRKKSKEERKRDREKDKERENAGAWAPKAFCSPFTVQHSRTRKIRGVRERTRTPRWGEDNEWRGCEEGERERSKEAREREREREKWIPSSDHFGRAANWKNHSKLSETRPLLAEDEFRSLCLACDERKTYR